MFSEIIGGVKVKIRVLDNEKNRRNYITRGIVGAELEVHEQQGSIIRCDGIYLFEDEYEVIEND